MCGPTVRIADKIYKKYGTPPFAQPWRALRHFPAVSSIQSMNYPPTCSWRPRPKSGSSIAPRPTHHSSLYLRPRPPDLRRPHFVLGGRSVGLRAALVVPWIRLDDRVLRAVFPPYWLAFYRCESGGAPCSVLSLFLLVHARVSACLCIGSKWRGGRRSDRERPRTLGVLRAAQAFPFPRAMTVFLGANWAEGGGGGAVRERRGMAERGMARFLSVFLFLEGGGGAVALPFHGWVN